MFRIEGLDTKTIKEIAESGCVFASFGIETASKKLQKTIGKNLSLTNAMRVVRTFKREGIRTRISLIYDLPKESLADFLDLLRFIKKTETDYYEFNQLALNPGSDFFNNSTKYFESIIRSNSKLERVRNTIEQRDLFIKESIVRFKNRSQDKKLKNDRKLQRFQYKHLKT